MKDKNLFDVIIIGSGPSGIFASLKLVNAGLKVALVDKGGNYHSRLKNKGKDLSGFGGAAMRYDANLDYLSGIPKNSSLGERVFGDRKVATEYIKEVYNKLNTFGLEIKTNDLEVKNNETTKNNLRIINSGILPIGEKSSIFLLGNIYNYLINKKLIFFDFTEVVDVTKNGIFNVEMKTHDKKKSTIKAKKVILATGKLSIVPSRHIFDRLGVNYDNCDTIDLGVRIETKKNSTDQITRGCTNPKIIFENSGNITKTFCWCSGGKVIDYTFEGMSIIDGQHCHDNPTDQANFGIVVTTKLPLGVDGTNLGINYLKTFNEFTGNKPGLQILKNYINGRVSSEKEIKNNKVTPTVSMYSLVDLNMLLIFDLKEKILNLIEKINQTYPHAICDNSLIYGPVLERIFPRVNLDFNMESSVKGFYVIGDISGKAIGVITGAAMGTKAASHILQTIGSN